jgi:hypothetical protein
MLIVAFEVVRDHHNRLFVMVLTYLRVDFWQKNDQIDPPTSSHSVFRPNPLEQRERKDKNKENDWSE